MGIIAVQRNNDSPLLTAKGPGFLDGGRAPFASPARMGRL